MLGDESVTATVFGDRSVVFRTGLTVVDISVYDGPGRLHRPLDSALLTAAAAIAQRASQ